MGELSLAAIAQVFEGSAGADAIGSISLDPFVALGPQPRALALAVALDLLIGDPVYAAHPVRLIGSLLSLIERGLRRLGLDGYGGGVLLFIMLAAVCVGGTAAVFVGISILGALAPLAPLARLPLESPTTWSSAWDLLLWIPALLHVFVLYSLLAIGDLLRHVWRVERGAMADDLPRARAAVSALVGRDTDRMDAAACRRAAIESLSESLTDGFISAICWYVLAGLPGLVLFKVVSTMDSMVGYKTPRYLRFGWCGARLDDVMNYVPARLAWLLIAAIALVMPGCSAVKAWWVGLRQHAILPGPNSGWSEAATAGAIQRRLVGPIWLRGTLVTEVWLGDPLDPPAQDHADVVRAITLITIVSIVATALACVALTVYR